MVEIPDTKTVFCFASPKVNFTITLFIGSPLKVILSTLLGFDKVILYNIWPHKKVKNFHRATARHHSENNIKKTRNDYIEMIIDWECARYTKPDKPLNAYDTLYKWYPELEKEILPILEEFNIAHHTVKE